MTAVGYPLVGGNGTATGRVPFAESQLLPTLRSDALRLAS